MEQACARLRCAAWGGASLGVGTLAYALCSPSNAGCSTSLVVLTHSTVTARGCAAYAVVAHAGVGLMVLGAVLLLGSFIVTVRARRQAGLMDPASEALPDQPTASAHPAETPTGVITNSSAVPDEAKARPRTSERVGPIPPGVFEAVREEATPEGPITLPPGWYGNPNNPERPVQWWDGTRLTDRPSRPAR